MTAHRIDTDRGARIGLDEALFCEPKSVEQIAAIVEEMDAAGRRMLLTRLAADKAARLPGLDYDPLSRTAFLGRPQALRGTAEIAIVTGGTGDLPVATEARRTLAFEGRETNLFADIGVAGLWRLQQALPQIAQHRIVIACAGMEASLPTVLAGLIPGLVIAVPTSTGYGTARSGETALAALLTSCAPGLVVCNIDNGYGAACAALRALVK